jgi:hypothetical protein
MLYLVRPYATLKWNDSPTRLALDGGAEDELDLADLEWELSDGRATTGAIRLALRHGMACSIGIVLPGVVLSDAYRPSDLRQIHLDLTESGSSAGTTAINRFLEEILPSWIKRDEQFDAENDRSKAEFLRRVVTGRTKLLAAAPQSHLVEHWESLGGIDPR